MAHFRARCHDPHVVQCCIRHQPLPVSRSLFVCTGAPIFQTATRLESWCVVWRTCAEPSSLCTKLISHTGTHTQLFEHRRHTKHATTATMLLRRACRRGACMWYMMCAACMRACTYVCAYACARAWHITNRAGWRARLNWHTLRVREEVDAVGALLSQPSYHPFP